MAAVPGRQCQTNRNRCRVWLGVAGVGLLVASAQAQATKDWPRITFLPHWIPQAQFAGPFVAADKGIYREHGLDVVVLEGGPRRPVGKWLQSGEAVMASHFLSSALKLREEGLPLVNLAQITQRSALLLVARKARGIRTVPDLDGKKVSVWTDFTAQPQALFRKYELNVRTIPQGPTINVFMRDGVDAVSAMWYNEYHLFLNSGLNEDELTVFFYDQHGLNFPEDGLYCLEATWRRYPEVCRQFVAATFEAWRYVFEHPTEALDIVLRRTDAARTGTNRSHQRWMLQRMRDLIQPDAARPMGELTREAYAQVVRALEESGELKAAPAFEAFCVGAHP
jgi:NitT/TauT family transport system substrate-binding protein